MSSTLPLRTTTVRCWRAGPPFTSIIVTFTTLRTGACDCAKATALKPNRNSRESFFICRRMLAVLAGSGQRWLGILGYELTTRKFQTLRTPSARGERLEDQLCLHNATGEGR